MKNMLLKGALVAVTALALPVYSTAVVISGSSDAFGVSTNISLLTLNLTVGPAPTTFGVAPAPYTNTNTLASLSASTTGLGSISTGIMTVNASSDVNGGAGSKFAMADATVNNLNFVLLPGAVPLLSLTAGQVFSSANVSGDFGLLTATGSTVLTNTVLNINGVPVTISSNPAPNTVAFNSLGILVILNEQLLTGNGTTSRGLTTNAIHITLTNVVGGGGFLNGDIVVSHSQAALTAVPEPTTLAAASVGLLFLARRRKRKINI